MSHFISIKALGGNCVSRVAAVYIASFSVRLLSGSHLKLCVHAFFSSLEGLWGCLIVRQCLCPLLSCCSKSLFSKSHFFFPQNPFSQKERKSGANWVYLLFFFFLFIYSTFLMKISTSLQQNCSTLSYISSATCKT